MGRLNIKISSCQYRISYYKDRTVSWPFYSCCGNPDAWKDSLMLKRAFGLEVKMMFQYKIISNIFSAVKICHTTISDKICYVTTILTEALKWRHNGHDGVSNHQPPIVYLTVYSSADQGKHQNCASLAFVRGIHQWPVNSSYKWSVTQKIISFDDVIMGIGNNKSLHKDTYLLSHVKSAMSDDAVCMVYQAQC